MRAFLYAGVGIAIGAVMAAAGFLLELGANAESCNGVDAATKFHCSATASHVGGALVWTGAIVVLFVPIWIFVQSR